MNEKTSLFARRHRALHSSTCVLEIQTTGLHSFELVSREEKWPDRHRRRICACLRSAESLDSTYHCSRAPFDFQQLASAFNNANDASVIGINLS